MALDIKKWLGLGPKTTASSPPPPATPSQLPAASPLPPTRSPFPGATPVGASEERPQITVNTEKPYPISPRPSGTSSPVNPLPASSTAVPKVQLLNYGPVPTDFGVIMQEFSALITAPVAVSKPESSPEELANKGINRYRKFVLAIALIGASPAETIQTQKLSDSKGSRHYLFKWPGQAFAIEVQEGAGKVPLQKPPTVAVWAEPARAADLKKSNTAAWTMTLKKQHADPAGQSANLPNGHELFGHLLLALNKQGLL